MKRILIAILVLAVSSPLLAQGRSVDASLFMTWVDLSGSAVIEQASAGDATIDFKSDTGFGAAINIFVARRLSAEFALSQVKPEGRIQYGAGTAVGQLDMLPITGVAQYHFNPDGRIDPYVGVGVAYLIFRDFNSHELESVGIRNIDFRNDYGMVYAAGLTWNLAGGIALLADAKYVPTSNEITADIGTGTVELNPLIVSAGVSIKF